MSTDNTKSPSWAERLEELLMSNQRSPVVAIRRFIVEVMKTGSGSNDPRIMVGDTVVHTFADPKRSIDESIARRNAYIESMSKDKGWLDATAMRTFAAALNVTLNIHIKSTNSQEADLSFVAYESTGRSAPVYHAVHENGNHWVPATIKPGTKNSTQPTLQTKQVPGDGNCGAHTLLALYRSEVSNADNLSELLVSKKDFQLSGSNRAALDAQIVKEASIRARAVQGLFSDLPLGQIVKQRIEDEVENSQDILSFIGIINSDSPTAIRNSLVTILKESNQRHELSQHTGDETVFTDDEAQTLRAEMIRRFFADRVSEGAVDYSKAMPLMALREIAKSKSLDNTRLQHALGLKSNSQVHVERLDNITKDKLIAALKMRAESVELEMQNSSDFRLDGAVLKLDLPDCFKAVLLGVDGISDSVDSTTINNGLVLLLKHLQSLSKNIGCDLINSTTATVENALKAAETCKKQIDEIKEHVDKAALLTKNQVEKRQHQLLIDALDLRVTALERITVYYDKKTPGNNTLTKLEDDYAKPAKLAFQKATHLSNKAYQSQLWMAKHGTYKDGKFVSLELKLPPLSSTSQEFFSSLTHGQEKLHIFSNVTFEEKVPEGDASGCAQVSCAGFKEAVKLDHHVDAKTNETRLTATGKTASDVAKALACSYFADLVRSGKISSNGQALESNFYFQLDADMISVDGMQHADGSQDKTAFLQLLNAEFATAFKNSSVYGGLSSGISMQLGRPSFISERGTREETPQTPEEYFTKQKPKFGS